MKIKISFKSIDTLEATVEVPDDFDITDDAALFSLIQEQELDAPDNQNVRLIDGSLDDVHAERA